MQIDLTPDIPTAESEEPKCQGHARLRVLISEDDIDAADMLRAAVELGAFDVEVAYDGVMGLELARTFTPEIVLCDLGLPIMDGLEVARQVRMDPVLRSIHLVALTGHTSAKDLDDVRLAGFDRYVAKPPSLAELVEVLASAAMRCVRKLESSFVTPS